MEFTREQALAVGTRDRDILVSAGAGAGKTRVLVNRIADRITDPDAGISADEILVMTFTNAAAQEMKERIGSELSERLERDPDSVSIRRQIRLIRQADISTIHSFCNRLLKTHFQDIGLDPSFRIGEEGELALLAHQTMEEVLEESFENGDPAFLKLVETFVTGKDDRVLEEVIATLYRFSRGFPDGRAWCEGQIGIMQSLCDPDRFDASLPAVHLKEKTVRILDSLEDKLMSLRLRCGRLLEESGQAIPDRYEALLKETEQLIDSLKGLSDYHEYREVLYALDFPALLRARKDEKEYLYLEDIRDTYKDVRDTLTSLRDKDYAFSARDLCRDYGMVLPCLTELSRLALRYGEVFFQNKKERNVYDFDDLEHMTLELLIDGYDEQGQPVPSGTARMLSRKYKEIFVDEYQDTSMIQETILTLLHQPGLNHLFTVGDIKQSIYRFRQARPDLFLARLSSYERDPDASAASGLRIELRDNFRSAPDVLYLCNKVFYALMDEDFGGISYDDDNALRVGEGSMMASVTEESDFMLLVEDEEKDTLPFAYDALYAETAMIAGRIRELRDQGYRYEDMVILLRSAGDRAETMAEYLKIMGIPAACESRQGYFSSREVAVILNFLAVIDNVRQDIPMASVLLSPIGGFTEEELARIKCQADIGKRDDFCLFDLLVMYSESGEDEGLRGRTNRFLGMLSLFRKQKKEMPLHKLLWNIYQETGYYYDVWLMTEGDKRRENLNMLLAKAEEYEKTVFKGLFYFIRYIDQIRSYDIELPEAGSRSAPADRVRIMTIHKSKGLEFPVVFVSTLAVQFNFNDSRRNLLLHPEYGMGMDATDLERRLRRPTLMKNMIKDQINKEMLEEEMRILYVGMTRAKNRLVLTGVVRQSSIDQQNEHPLSYGDKIRARSFMDWLLPVFFGSGCQVYEDMSKYLTLRHLNQLDFPDLPKEDSEGTDVLADMLSAADLPEDHSPVTRAFSYVYPYASSVTFKRKYSVSELKRMSMTAPSEEGDSEPDYAEYGGNPEKVQSGSDQGGILKAGTEDIPLPAFLSREQAPDPAMRGTIVHKIMELLPFAAIETDKDLLDSLKIIEKEYKKTELLSMKDVYIDVKHFLFSEEGDKIRQMDREGRLFREVPFTVSLPACFAGAEEDLPETIIVQGVIDAYGEDEEGLWLIDYKTDSIRDGEESLLLDRYQKQMLYYKTALTMLIRKPVCKTSIYSFALNRFITVPV